jgi:hypothetical protein
MKKIDWIKGHPFRAYSVQLPRGYSIDISVSQRQSGKVTVDQTVSKTIGFFDFNTFQIKTKGNDPFDTTFMDKLNKILKFTRVIR